MERLELLKKRRSVRDFTNQPIPKPLRDELSAIVTDINTHIAGLKFRLFFDNSDPFKGFFKSYGSFVNPHNYLAAVVDEGFDHIWEKAGYFAEKFVIECVAKGLGTCFVGGTYDANAIDVMLRAGEKILFVVIFGFPSGKLRWKEKVMVDFIHRKKYEPKDFFVPSDKFDEECVRFKELYTGAEAVACSPSALNKRPVRIFVREDEEGMTLCGKVPESNRKNLIDLGIAKFNYNYATGTQCEWGNGSPLSGGEF